MKKINLIIFIIFSILIYYYNFYVPDVYYFSSKIKGVNLFILGSVHGNEPAGTNACYKLIDLLKKGKIKVKSGSIIH